MADTCFSSTESSFFIPIRGLNEYVYCPRLFHLVYVQGVFEDNTDTVKGSLAHKKRLTKTKAAASANQNDDTVPWPEEKARHVSLSSNNLSIVGKFDILLEGVDETIPVEVKKGPAPDGTHSCVVGPYTLSPGAWNNDQVQLAGQMALLCEAGYQCRRGRIYYRQTRTLVEINADTPLMDALRWVADQAKALAGCPMPEPFEDSPKCVRCSLNHICLPDETLHLKKRLDEPRQLYPGRDDCGQLHITTPGTRIGKSGESLKISPPDEKAALIPLKDIAHVCCWGNVQLTTQALLELADRGIGVTWLTAGGWLRAVTTAPLEKNVQLRRTQYRHCDNAALQLQFTRNIVAAKIENQRTLLRRNGDQAELGSTLGALRDIRKHVVKADSLERIRGLEGSAARLYWDAFPSLMPNLVKAGFSMNGRTKRPPKDPVNVLLSFGYAMLLRDFMTAIHSAGLDPLYGFYHAIIPGRPALALDLMEPFRPLVVDSAALRAMNEGRFVSNDFAMTTSNCAFKSEAKKKWIKAYEQRVDTMVTHPIFGYRLNYRRIFSLEARLFGRVIMGELEDYKPLTTR
ncbi:CRISPR-associated endonuclease Cas4/Cas1 [Desulfovibrio inopinatus]|uniref:CRISPR-associated endonuclease Cas4/Cas1 n=1 Tax=Desulfovibrio inopinatus TaxID=102109 RepID=UPI0003FA9561|nr:CRISPR-associated endonuclease Cas4/Cas1 [Desulfovibrio inopinatus]